MHTFFITITWFSSLHFVSIMFHSCLVFVSVCSSTLSRRLCGLYFDATFARLHHQRWASWCSRSRGCWGKRTGTWMSASLRLDQRSVAWCSWFGCRWITAFSLDQCSFAWCSRSRGFVFLCVFRFRLRVFEGGEYGRPGFSRHNCVPVRVSSVGWIVSRLVGVCGCVCLPLFYFVIFCGWISARLLGVRGLVVFVFFLGVQVWVFRFRLRGIGADESGRPGFSRHNCVPALSVGSFLGWLCE